MKILFDSLIFGLQKRGGASNYWLEFYKRFCKDYECSIYKMSDDKYLNKQFLSFDGKYQAIHDKKFKPSLLRAINPPSFHTDEKMVFHSTCYRFLKNKKIKNIVTIHDFTHQKYMNFYHKTMNSKLKKRAIKHADGIVCISQNTYKDMLKFYPKSKNKRNVVIYNGANFEIFCHLDNPVLSKKYEALVDKKFILFVGQRDGYKNFDFILEVLKNTEDLYLCLVGGNDLNLNSSQFDKIKNRILHFNNVSDEELNVLYNKSFCFIYPSLYEGFGIPICEAMNSGCPVIAFNNSSIPEVMNGSGILLENNDLKGVLSALDHLQDEEYRNTLILNQYQACKKFSWDIAYQQMQEFYKRVLEDV